jgi:hypothetical protein
MTTEEVQMKIQEDPNFVYLKRFEHSIDRLEVRYPDGCPDHVIAQALLITEDDVVSQYNAIVLKLRRLMGVASP